MSTRSLSAADGYHRAQPRTEDRTDVTAPAQRNTTHGSRPTE